MKSSSNHNHSPFKNKDAMQELANQYLGADLVNPFADMTNQYADMQNQFLDMGNYYGDLNNQYAGMTNQFSGMTNQFANLANPYQGMTNQFAGMTNQFAGLENQFAGMENQYTGMSNRFAGLENTMEDATVNQQQAQFERDMFQQSQANVLGDLRGAAGGSGVAALAQQLAQSGQLQSQQASASIGAQEAQNQRAQLAEASRLQGMEAGEASRIDQLQRGEAGRIDQMTRQQAASLDMASAQAQAGLDMASAQGQTGIDMAFAQQSGANQLASAQGQTALDMASAQGQTSLDMAAAQGQTALDLGWANQQQTLDMAAAQGASSIDNLIASEQSNIDQQIASGDFALQGMELDRLATALGMSQAEIAASLQQQSMNNQANADAMGNTWGGIVKVLGLLAGTPACVPKGVHIDSIDGSVPIEDIKVGDMVIGYNGKPVPVLQKCEYLEDPSKKVFYKVEFNNGAIVNVDAMHKIGGVRAKDITEDVKSKEVHDGVKISYDLSTLDGGYRMNGIPVNSMILEQAKSALEFGKDINLKLKKVI
tara:strand:+ start:11146 stop:12762 length:1617 start_codon:yes stop_codon:yes gene_type:complete